MIAVLSVVLVIAIVEAVIIINKNSADSGAVTETEAVVTDKPGSEADIISDKIASMSLYEKVWQMFLVAPEDIIGADPVIQSGEVSRAAIEQYPVGGFIYFGKNIESREQVMDMISGAQSYSKTPLFIAVDEEGGRVARLGNADVGVTKFPPMAEIGAGGDREAAREIGVTLGSELTEMGFNVDFAPVADTITVENNDDIGDRSFGSDPDRVAEMVAAEVEGMQSQNLCATLKHFPSNGSTETNTHYEEGVCTRTLEEMRSVEFIPFKAGIDAGADMVMVAHMAVPDIVGGMVPSTLSSIVVDDLLRGELGFDGVVVSDALNMGAITSHYSPEEAAIAAVNAGVDILLMSPSAVNAADAVINAVNMGEISEARIDESVGRILALKMKRGIISE